MLGHSVVNGEGDGGGGDRSKLCVFCYKSTAITGEDGYFYFNESLRGSVEQLNKFVKLLQRYLERGEDGKDSFEVNYNGLLGCCRDCGIIINSFCETYHQLKCLELKLQWKLETLVKIMKLANRVPSRVQGLRGVFEEEDEESRPNCDRPGRIRLKEFKKSRMQMIKKCSQKLAQSQPRVLVKQHEINSITITEIADGPSISSNDNSKSDHLNYNRLETSQQSTRQSREMFLGWIMSFAAVALLVSTTPDKSVIFRNNRAQLFDEDLTSQLPIMIDDFDNDEVDFMESFDEDAEDAAENVTNFNEPTSQIVPAPSPEVDKSEEHEEPNIIGPSILRNLLEVPEHLEEAAQLQRQQVFHILPPLSPSRSSPIEVSTIPAVDVQPEKIVQEVEIEDETETAMEDYDNDANLDHVTCNIKTEDQNEKQTLPLPFHCSFCPKKFSRAQALSNHLKVHCSRDRVVQSNNGESEDKETFIKTEEQDGNHTQGLHCPTCSNQYSNAHSLNRHMITKHNKAGIEKPYKCKLCKLSFATNHRLNCHKMTSGKHKLLLKLFMKKRKNMKKSQSSSTIGTADSRFSVKEEMADITADISHQNILSEEEPNLQNITEATVHSQESVSSSENVETKDVRIEDTSPPEENPVGPPVTAVKPPVTAVKPPVTAVQPPVTAVGPPSTQRYNLREKRKQSYRMMDDDGNNQEENYNPSCSSSEEEEDEAESDISSSSSSYSDGDAKNGATTAGKRRFKEVSTVDANKPERFYCGFDECKERRWHCSMTKHQFEEHQKLHATGQFKCQFCEVIEDNVMKLGTHEINAHPNNDTIPEEDKEYSKNKKLFQCPRCDYQASGHLFYIWHFAESHISGFQKRVLDLNRVDCEICKSSVRELHKGDHFKRCHDLEGLTESHKIYRCIWEDCSAYFKTERQLRWHKKKVHTSSETDDDDDLNNVEEGTTLSKSFNCELCKKTFRSKLRLREHRNIYHRKSNPAVETVAVATCQTDQKNKFFICPEIDCTKNFQSKVDFENHCKLHGTFKCNFCGTVETFAPDLAIHESERHGVRIPTLNKEFMKIKPVFNCARCPFTKEKRGFYIRHHLTEHLGLIYGDITCPICKAVGVHKDFLRDHMKKNHDIEGLDPSKIFRCDHDHCPAYFIRNDQLVLHKVDVHIAPQGTVCPECKNKYVTRKRLREHIKLRHPHLVPSLAFVCGIHKCPFRFATEAELNKHKKIHNKDNTSKCSKCDQLFLNNGKLNAHFKRVHEKPSHICSECGKAFRTTGKLNLHMLYHKGPDSWKFQCSDRGKKCVDKQKLYEHMRTHTKEKPFQCQFCGEKYAGRHNWKNHVKTKHKEEYDKMEDMEGRTGKKGNYTSRKGSKKGDCILSKRD